MINAIPSGSKVGIITPSSSIESPEEIQDGLKYLQQTLGYNIVLGQHVFDDYHTMGGTPEQRAEDIMKFFKDDSIKAIFCTRGGYGGQYVLPFLDYDIIKNNPKPIIGFSDITSLQMGIYTKTGNVSYAGPLLKYDYAEKKPNLILERSLKDILSGITPQIRGGFTAVSGKSSGVMLGTNLAVFQLLAGTEYYPKLDNAVLLLEDVDTATYVFETHLLHLRQQKDFHKLKGIIFGQVTDTFIRRPGQKDINEVIDQFVQNLKIPVIKNFPFGHIAARSVIPLGIKVEMDADNCTLKFE